ncbi:hypothetical protein BOFL111202_26380 [Bordetella flabilis]
MGARQHARDFRAAGTAAGAAVQGLLQAVHVQAGGNAGFDGFVRDAVADADGASAARRCAAAHQQLRRAGGRRAAIGPRRQGVPGAHVAGEQEGHGRLAVQRHAAQDAAIRIIESRVRLGQPQCRSHFLQRHDRGRMLGGHRDAQAATAHRGGQQHCIGKAPQPWRERPPQRGRVAFQPTHGLPGQLRSFDGDGAVLELRLVRIRVARRIGERVDAVAGDKRAAPVHRQEGVARLEALVGAHGHEELSAPRLDPGQRAVGQPQALHIARMQRQARLFDVPGQRQGQRGARHRMPVIAQPPRGQAQRILRRHRFRHGRIAHVHEAGAAVGRGEATVGIEPRYRACVGVVGPLLRAVPVQDVIGQGAVIQVAPRGGPRMFCENLALIGVVEACSLRGRDARRQPGRHGRSQAPVRPRIPGRRDGRAYAADTPFGVGHRAVLLRPGGGRQHQIRVGQGFAAGVGVLHDNELCLVQGRPHARLVGQGLRRVGRHDPQQLDASVPRGVEHVDGGQSRRCGQAVHAPQRRDGGTVGRIGRVAVAG